MARAALGLGANLGEPQRQIEQALAALAVLPATRLLARSTLYRSDPVGPPGQPDYCNAAALVETGLEPLELLDAVQALEDAAGRVRGGLRWAARPLDIDLLDIDGQRLAHPRLVLPHPHIGTRNWVLLPLAEIAPDLEIPGLGRADALAARLGSTGLRRWG